MALFRTQGPHANSNANAKCKFEAKSGTAQKVVSGIYEEPISAKTQENPAHCHVPLTFSQNCLLTRNIDTLAPEI